MLHVLALATADYIGAPSLPRLPAGHQGVVVRLATTHPEPDQKFIHRHAARPDARAATPADPASKTDQNPAAPDSTAASVPSQTDTAIYYHRSELAIPATLLTDLELPVPAVQLEGFARLTLLIGEDGTVDAVLTGKSTFPTEYLDQLKTVFAEMKFQPGIAHGKPAKSRFEIEVSTSYLPETIESKTLDEETGRP